MHYLILAGWSNEPYPIYLSWSNLKPAIQPEHDILAFTIERAALPLQFCKLSRLMTGGYSFSIDIVFSLNKIII